MMKTRATTLYKQQMPRRNWGCLYESPTDPWETRFNAHLARWSFTGPLATYPPKDLLALLIRERPGGNDGYDARVASLPAIDPRLDLACVVNDLLEIACMYLVPFGDEIQLGWFEDMCKHDTPMFGELVKLLRAEPYIRGAFVEILPADSAILSTALLLTRGV